MPKVTFIAEQGGKPTSDSQQTIVNVAGIDPTGTDMVLTRNFEPKTNAGTIYEVGIGTERHPDALRVTAEVAEEDLDCYPYIGFTTTEARQENGVTIIEKCRLWGVSIGAQPNADPTIKTIRQQWKEQLLEQEHKETPELYGPSPLIELYKTITKNQ